MKPLFVFCGPIGSGKSSVSKKFAQQIGAKWNSFGSTTREIAKERNIPDTRTELQTLGAHLIENEREIFCKRVLALVVSNTEDAGVVDGLRHGHVLQEFRDLIKPRKLICVYVDVAQDVRSDRVLKRDGIDADALAKLDSHSTEVQVQKELKKLADFVANNNGTPEDCVAQIIRWAKL